MSQPTTEPNAAGIERSHDAESEVIEWLRKELDDPGITGTENFLDIGGHSLTFARLNAFLSENFGATLDPKKTYEESLSSAVAGMKSVAGMSGG